MVLARLVSVIVFAVIVATGCGNTSDDEVREPVDSATAGSNGSADDATADADSASPGAEDDTTPDEQPEPAAADAQTRPNDAEVDPSDAYFALERVLEVSIEIAADDWDTLRHQTRTFEDLTAEIEEFGLSQPLFVFIPWAPTTRSI